MATEIKRIGLFGYARSGKSTIAKFLCEQGFALTSPGTIIKRQLEDLVQKELGFSAFTEDDAQKKLIRPLLEIWGEVAYDKIQAEFLGNLPLKCVNARIQTKRQVQDWIDAGGKVFFVERPGCAPETEFEDRCISDIFFKFGSRNLNSINNGGTIEDLKQKALALCN